MVASVAALLDKAMGAQQSEVLRHPCCGQIQPRMKVVHVMLFNPQFFNDPNPVGVRKHYYRDEDAIVMWAVDVDGAEYTARLEELRRSLP